MAANDCECFAEDDEADEVNFEVVALSMSDAEEEAAAVVVLVVAFVKNSEDASFSNSSKATQVMIKLR